MTQRDTARVRLSSFILLSALLILSSCSPSLPTPPPRVIFPTDSRPAPTADPTLPPAPTHTPRPTPVAPPITEYRALWVDGFSPGLQTPEQIARLVRDCQSISCNVLVTQIRIHANAVHAKSSEPRASSYPFGFDPLTEVISRAHSASPPIEVYAWMNAFPVWPTDDDPPSDPRHIFNTHGLNSADNWLTLNEQGDTSGTGLHYLDPGHPAAARHVISQVVSVVQNYPVDGVHLDFIRYGGMNWGYNKTSVERFNARLGRTSTPAGAPAQDDAQWSQWRRDQVSAVVRRIWLESTAINPRVKVSAALIPWGAGPSNDADWQNSSAYRAVFQDWRAWLQEGILDIAFPMNYFSESTLSANFDQWIEFEKNHRYNRHVVIGMGNYLNSADESIAQIRRARSRSTSGARADGIALYVYAQIGLDRLPFSQFVEATTLGPLGNPVTPIFAPPAFVPPMPWKSAPATGHLMGLVLKDNAPVDGAQVAVVGPSPATTARAATADGSGFYGVVDLSPGTYRVSSGQANGSTASGSVTIRAGTVATLTLTLPR